MPSRHPIFPTRPVATNVNPSLVAIAAPPPLPAKTPALVDIIDSDRATTLEELDEPYDSAEAPRIARIDDCDVHGRENAILANVI